MTNQHSQSEELAVLLMNQAAQEGWVSAECATDKDHPCLVIWSESAEEHLGAFLNAAHEKSYAQGVAGALSAMAVVVANMPLKSLTRGEIVDILLSQVNEAKKEGGL
jgi:hypothetical protein